MNKRARAIAGLLLVAVALFNITPEKIASYIRIWPVNPVVVVDKPSEELIKMTKPIADMVTEKSDREMIAVYYNELGSRKYSSITMQNVNDIMNISGKEYYNGALRNSDGTSQYPGLADAIKTLVDVQEVDSQDTTLNADQLAEFSRRCKALAWNMAR
jgi:hypothetical protein